MDDVALNRKAWVTLSVAMASRDDPMSMPEVQQLCGLNAQLIMCERRFAASVRPDQTPDEALRHSFELNDILAASWLWVLGAYEVFRRAKHRRGPLADASEFHALNEAISEIRIVLAKREARANKKVRQVPQVLLAQDGSVGWGFWDRRLQHRQFFRAHFARDWIAQADRLRELTQAGR